MGCILRCILHQVAGWQGGRVAGWQRAAHLGCAAGTVGTAPLATKGAVATLNVVDTWAHRVAGWVHGGCRLGTWGLPAGCGETECAVGTLCLPRG